MSATSEILTESLHRDFGFSLFPLTATKRPAVQWKRYQGQQCSITELYRWMEQHDRFGVATGRLSNLVAVDLDSQEALDWARAHLPETPWVVLTGLKNDWFRGQHWYYRYPAKGNEARNTVRVNVNGEELALDIRGEGGYVVAPGSPHESGVTYEQTQPWDPSDNVPAFDPAWFPVKPVPTPRREPLTLSQGDMETRFGNWLAAKPAPYPGRRNSDTYSAACAGYDFGLPEGVIFDLVWSWNKSGPEPLGEKEVWQCVRSAGKSKQAPMYPKGEVKEAEPPRQAEKPAPQHAREELPPVECYDEPIDSEPEPTQAEHTMDSRVYTERSYIWAAVDHEPTARVLAAFGNKRFQDPASAAAHAAFEAILNDGREPSQYNLSQALARAGKFHLFETLLSFYERYVQPSGQFRSEAYKDFRRACDWDDLRALLTAELSAVGQGDYDKAKVRLYEGVSAIMAKADTHKKPRTLKQAILDRLDEIESGEADRKAIRLRLVDQEAGAFGVGDALYMCGPPKSGKTGVLMQLLRDAAQDGHTCLYGQLELREDQIADREGFYMFGKPLSETTAAERSHMRSGGVDQYEGIILTGSFTDLESYGAAVSQWFAQHPEITVWGTDYNERLQEFGGKSDPQAQTEAVSHFVKHFATVYKKLGILLTQPKEDYFKDCYTQNKPRLTHWKRGRKYQQDGQALFFLHNPREFDDRYPADYLELHLQLCRSAPPAMIPIRADKRNQIYVRWTGPLPDAASDAGGPPRPALKGGGRATRSTSLTSGKSRMDLTVPTEDLDDPEIEEALGKW